MNKIFIFYILFFVCIDCICQEGELEIKIIQRILPGPNPEVIYQLTNNRFSVYHVKTRKKRIFTKRLSQTDIDSLISLVDIDRLNELNSNYSGNGLDGINWTFKISLNKLKKEIYIDNYYLPELDMLLTYLNKSLPKKYRQIKFDYFNIKKEYLEKNKR